MQIQRQHVRVLGLHAAQKRVGGRAVRAGLRGEKLDDDGAGRGQGGGGGEREQDQAGEGLHISSFAPAGVCCNILAESVADG